MISSYGDNDNDDICDHDDENICITINQECTNFPKISKLVGAKRFTCSKIDTNDTQILVDTLLTYLLHAAESFLRS